jgi:hypothetical protein
MPRPIVNANDFIEQQLDIQIAALESRFKANVLTFSGGILFGVDDLWRVLIEKRYGQEPRRRAIVILTTNGGYIEVVHRMVEVLRRHYRLVDFVIPNYAYSAGTVFAMSGDAIFMDYYSRLGPIDPQVSPSGGSKLVPALGYLEKYRELIDKAASGNITDAEVQLLISGFDQAELYQYEHAQALSITLMKEWLVKYKFKNWKRTASRKLKVTKAMKEERAEKIGAELSNSKKWHSHGYGISKEVLEKDLKLLVDDFGSDASLSMMIRSYHDLLSDYMGKRDYKGLIHIKGECRPFM